MKTPSIPLVRIIISAKYVCTFILMLVQLPKTVSGMMKVVSRIIISAMPSMPSVKRMPQVGIHCVSTAACHPVFAGLNDHQSPAETRNSTSRTKNAITRACPFDDSEPALLPEASPSTSSNTAPTSGMISSAGSTQDSYPIDWRKASISFNEE